MTDQTYKLVPPGLKALSHWLFRGRWKAVPCGWPYRPGWATYCPRRHLVLDTGLTRDQAEAKAEALNKSFQ